MSSQGAGWSYWKLKGSLLLVSSVLFCSPVIYYGKASPVLCITICFPWSSMRRTHARLTLTCSVRRVPVWGRWLSGEQSLIQRGQGQNNRQHHHMVRGVHARVCSRTWGRAFGGVRGRTAPGRSSTTTWGRWRRRLGSPESVSGTRWAGGRDESPTLWNTNERKCQRQNKRLFMIVMKPASSSSGTVCECQRLRNRLPGLIPSFQAITLNPVVDGCPATWKTWIAFTRC